MLNTGKLKKRRSGVDNNGLLAHLDSKQEKRLDRSIRYECDEFDRVAKIDCGRGQGEPARFECGFERKFKKRCIRHHRAACKRGRPGVSV